MHYALLLQLAFLVIEAEEAGASPLMSSTMASFWEQAIVAVIWPLVVEAQIWHWPLPFHFLV